MNCFGGNHQRTYKMSKGVLIVEDDALLSVIQTRIVEHLGHSVVASVHTGREAIEKVRTENPDVILMDIGLGGDLDGIETMEEIRKSSSVPVIYLSGDSGSRNSERIKAIGPIGYLTKPVKKYELESTFKKAFATIR